MLSDPCTARLTNSAGVGYDFGVGDDVLVLQEETDDSSVSMAPELKGRWVARILEIRGTNPNDVYFLVNWYNRPEDLTAVGCRREPHHGMSELVGTNSVDIIDIGKQSTSQVSLAFTRPDAEQKQSFQRRS